MNEAKKVSVSTRLPEDLKYEFEMEAKRRKIKSFEAAYEQAIRAWLVPISEQEPSENVLKTEHDTHVLGTPPPAKEHQKNLAMVGGKSDRLPESQELQDWAELVARAVRIRNPTLRGVLDTARGLLTQVATFADSEPEAEPPGGKSLNRGVSRGTPQGTPAVEPDRERPDRPARKGGRSKA